jgi:hypothetical protein
VNFVQTGFLIGAAAIAIPVAIHLLSRWQIRRLELGTMRFLLEVIHDTARRRRIRRWLLLFTRAALMLLLALLFARPYLTEAMIREGNDLRIVLVDRSSSMGMPGQDGRLVDDALIAAHESLSRLGPEVAVRWAWFDRHVEPLPTHLTRPAPPRVVAGGTNYAAALQWARNQLNASPDANADVILATDLQRSGLRSDEFDRELLSFPQDVPVRIIDVGRTAANNLAITSAVPASTEIHAGQDVRLTITLFNYGSLSFDAVPATAAASDGSRTVRLKKSVNVLPGEAEELSFNLGPLEPGRWRITFAIDVADDLAVDNRRFAAVEVVEPIRTLLLDSGSSVAGSSAESYFLQTALSQTDVSISDRSDQTLDEEPRGRFDVQRVFLEEESSRIVSADEFPLTVVANAGAIPAATVQRLENYVRAGGRLLIFAGQGIDETAPFWNEAGLAPGSFSVPRTSGVMPFRIESIERSAPMMRPFSDPQHADLSRLAFHKILPVVPDEQTRVLAWFDEQRPAVTGRACGSGRVVWFLSSADSSWGNWTTSPLYLPLVRQMASDLLNLTGEGRLRYRTLGDEDTSRSEPEGGASETAEGDRSQDDRSLPVFSHPGFEQREEALYVVNGSAGESDPTRIGKSAFSEILGLTVLDESGQKPGGKVVTEKRNELWPWLAAAVFILIVGEFGLANRTTA